MQNCGDVVVASSVVYALPRLSSVTDVLSVHSAGRNMSDVLSVADECR